jgi:hypothetical protein
VRRDVVDAMFELERLAVRPRLDLVESGGDSVCRAAVPAASIRDQ